jgi:hypothetical protein
MPLYSYDCEDCGAVLEILHPVSRGPQLCGLDCQLRGEGSFGRGRVKQALSAANVSLSRGARSPSPASDTAGSGELDREAMRKEALSRMGGELTEADMNKLRDSGMTVYRRSGKQRWEKDGGASDAPREIRGDKGDGS